MKVVFCTANKDRTFHLQQTLPQNLADNADYPDVKFVVVNYSSQDHLIDYLQENHAADLDSGRLVHYHYTEAPLYRMAHAKNMSHRLGILEGADVLCNLDADNWTGRGFASYIARQFKELPPRTFLWANVVPGEGLRGCNGRLIVSPQAYLNVGGYDERYNSWGSDDKDFHIRLRRLGYKESEIDRRYLDSIKHNDAVRFRDYPHARYQPTGEHATFFENDNTIVNFGKIGLGVVYRNFVPVPVTVSPVPTRIFGIGMHKTATNSLHAALKQLGLDSAHWPSGIWARDVYNEMTSVGRSRTLERSYAACDLPITILYKELDKAYPGSKFILTVRDDDKWLQSVRRHWSREHNPFRWEWDVYPVNNKIHKLVYGRTTFDADVMLARYVRHNAEVRAYFKNRPGDLLIMDMERGAGWKELCGFLGKPIVDGAYPREYVNGKGDGI